MTTWPQQPRTDVDCATDLASALRGGWQPPPVRGWIRLLPGEALVAELPCLAQQYSGTDVTYQQTTLLAFGGLGWLAASAAGSALWNASRRRKAAAQAAAQWRWVDRGVLFFTSRRLALLGEQTWVDYFYEHLRGAAADDVGLLLFVAGVPHTRLLVHNPLTHLVLLRYLAFGEVPELPAQHTPSPLPAAPSGLPVPDSAWLPPRP